MTKNAKKLAAEVWYDWCSNIYHTRPNHRYLNSSMGEDIFNLCFDIMRQKFQSLLVRKYGVQDFDEKRIPNVLIDPSDWKDGDNFWRDILIFMRYRLSEAEIKTTMKLLDWSPSNTRQLKAYIQFTKGFNKLRKMQPVDEKVEMTERQYIADFTTLCVERVADNAAFVPSKTLHECFKRYMAAHHPSAEPISGKLFLQLFDSQDGMKNLLCMKCFLASSPDATSWGFKNLALTPAGKKLLEETK